MVLHGDLGGIADLAETHFKSSPSAAAVMEHAEPISAWQPHSAPEMEAFVLMRSPITPPAASARTIASSEKPRSSSYKGAPRA